MKLPDAVMFASDAEIALFTGAVVLALAALTNVAERRRIRRARIDQVGWIPWTGLFLMLMVVGVTLVVLGATGLLKG